MTAEAQPFMSGAISKTIDMPAMATVEDRAKAYLDRVRRGGRPAWRGETARTRAPRPFGQLGTVVPRSQVFPSMRCKPPSEPAEVPRPTYAAMNPSA